MEKNMNFTNYLYRMIGLRLKKKINDSYTTQAQFTRKVKDKYQTEGSDLPINEPTLSNILQGKPVNSQFLMSQEKIEIFAKMFNVTHEELIFESENEILNFFKFSLLLILFNNSDSNPFIDTSTDDIFFGNATYKNIFKDSFMKEEILINLSNKLLINIISSSKTDTDLDTYIGAFNYHCDDYMEFFIDFKRLIFNNTLHTNFLFEYILNSKENYQVFISSFNNFIDINSDKLLEFYKEKIKKEILKKSKGNNDSIFARLNNNFFIEVFSSEQFLNLLERSLNIDNFILFISKAKQTVNEFDTSSSICMYYDKDKLDKDVEYLKKFYNDNQNKKIKSLTELNLNILDFIDLTNFLENQLI